MVARPQRRMATLRRDLNDLVRGPDGKVSAVKVGSATGQWIAAYLLLKYPAVVLLNWEILTVLFSVLILPDSLKKTIQMRYGGTKT